MAVAVHALVCGRCNCTHALPSAAARHPFLFYEVLEGMDIVTKVEAIGSSSGTPSKKVTIADSGELPVEAKTDEI